MSVFEIGEMIRDEEEESGLADAGANLTENFTKPNVDGPLHDGIECEHPHSVLTLNPELNAMTQSN